MTSDNPTTPIAEQPFSLATLGGLHPKLRLAYVRKHEPELEFLTFAQLDEVGLRLLSASSQKMKDEYPVLGERMDRYHGPFISEQEKFEASVALVPDPLQALYGSLETDTCD